uniref:RBR-type E3 ubiquitin transferase n=1 Tax=Florenciella parvula TaxID=236787 RepID=A0A7S2CZA5_9STRA|mmetsp:Transcript_7318/g.15214  ORF Transcript_7318/g.15214 Transcript_7318/m.15214 type:complete len:542 (+) Transcript_7318:762-2387(+)
MPPAVAQPTLPRPRKNTRIPLAIPESWASTKMLYEHILEFSTTKALLTGIPPTCTMRSAALNAAMCSARALATSVESGETLLYVLVATIAVSKPNSKARATLVGYLRRLVATPEGEAQVAAFIPVRPIDSRNPRTMWGFTEAPNELVEEMTNSAIAIARATEDEELLEALLLPPSFSTLGGDGGGGCVAPLASASTVCEVCYDCSFQCCEAGGRMVRVSDAPGCGHVVCPTAAGRWIETQVEEQRGVGEIVCPCCPYVLTPSEVCRLAPERALFERADRMALEKALLSMNNEAERWIWCPGGCGGGGVGTRSRARSGCLTYVCSTASCGLEFCATPGCAVALSNHTRPALANERPFDVSATKPLPAALGFKVGDEVTIHGLKNSVKYNFCHATVSTGLYSNGFVGVYVHSFKKGIKVKPANLVVVKKATKVKPTNLHIAGRAMATREKMQAAEVAAEEVAEQPTCMPEGQVWVTCAMAAGQQKSAEYMSTQTKACPGCGVNTARDGGCSHMTCKMCKFEWCWLCNGKYKPGRYTMGNKCPC